MPKELNDSSHRLLAFASMMMLAAVGLAAAIAMQAYHSEIIVASLAADITYISVGIIVIFVTYIMGTLIVAYSRITGRMGVEAFNSIFYLGNGLKTVFVSVGLVGTVIGFMMALSGVDASVVSNIDAIGPMVSTLIQGMGIALTTTLVGAVAAVYAEIHNRLFMIAGR